MADLYFFAQIFLSHLAENTTLILKTFFFFSMTIVNSFCATCTVTGHPRFSFIFVKNLSIFKIQMIQASPLLDLFSLLFQNQEVIWSFSSFSAQYEKETIQKKWNQCIFETNWKNYVFDTCILN